MKLRYYHMKDPSHYEIWAITEAAWKTKQIKTYYGTREGLTNPPAWQRLTAITVCEITQDLPGVDLVCGYAFCSVRDNFCRVKGRKIALGRAARQLGMSARAVEECDRASRFLKKGEKKGIETHG